eukprot:CAMPEP_0173391934 /NCGR_PEP_ID=MMETSP1356-20130122/18669_1 /TAXON_ID=77927 ORGANISM="Hemiselmis virescens, Strain PCC157" /NCGR_SAMPLE_ID=MMETSP1356 /ASSEMBLY_ACC=CAM_ASM_000847 /LENGTH=163 /DNA_ID=CAMNT_0014349637 /DNA_START=162 /DNA_END=649 /DNA_ORIENTATION=+
MGCGGSKEVTPAVVPDTKPVATAAPAPAAAQAASEQKAAPAAPVKEAPPAVKAEEAPKPSSTSGPKIAIIYYSTYGHVRTMAGAMKKGIEAGGGTATLLQIPETLSAEVLGKMGAPPKSDDPVVEVTALEGYDGFMFGVSGRFGSFPAQFKQFWDSTGGLWQG